MGAKNPTFPPQYHSGRGGGSLTSVHCSVKLLRDGLVALSDGGARLPAPGPAVRLNPLWHRLLVRPRVFHLLGYVFTLLDGAPAAGVPLGTGTHSGAGASSPVGTRRVTQGNGA